MDPRTLRRKNAVEAAWRRGMLRFLLDEGREAVGTCGICGKLHTGQKGMYDAIKSKPGNRWYLELSRRRGKTFFLVVMAIEAAITKPNAQIYYAASTVKAIKKMVKPNFRKILKDCPADMQPRWNSMDSEYRFQNGSVITIAGCDGQNYENLRGTEADFIIIDEAGFMDDLEAVLDDVLTPMTLETGATILISSTPPRSLEHYACTLAQQAQNEGLYFHQTVYDNPRLTYDQIERFIRKMARGRPIDEFKKSVTFRREMLAERVADENWLVIPEWQEKGTSLIYEPQIPAFFDAYVSTDTGFRDGWGVLFGYWDYLNAKLVIQDELLFFGKRISFVSEEIKKKINILWGDKKVYKKVGDIPDLVLGEMAENGLYFSKTEKADKEEQINRARELIANNKIIVLPRAEKMLAQLRNTIWNMRKDDYVRGLDGHGDLIDALVYMVRNLDRNRNPYPANTRVDSSRWYSPQYREKSSQEKEAIYKLIGKKPKPFTYN